MTAALAVDNLSKRFDGVVALDSVSLAFGAGQVTGLVGPNGAGKTTLFNAIMGFVRPDVGQVYVHGRAANGKKPYQISRLGVARLFQDVRVFDKMTALENVITAFREQSGECLWRCLLAPRALRRDERQRRSEAMEALDYVGLAERARARAEDLSYGQQKLLALARVIASGGDILLLDEPTAGVHPGMVRQILSLVRSLAGQGKTVVLIEHNMGVISETADWVVFLENGRVSAFGQPDEVLGDPQVRRVFMGL